MDNIAIYYVFTWPDKTKNRYEVELDAETLNIVNHDHTSPPQWTQLDFHKCPHCTLNSADHPHCPLALTLVAIHDHFIDLASYEDVHIEVITPERTIVKDTTAQRAISSLMGLIIPCSGCPHTGFFKPMARFHLPFAEAQETVYRASSMYLLAQYFCNEANNNIDFDLSGLNAIYKTLHEINQQCALRLRESSSNDSTVNSVILLDILAKSLPYAIEDSLEELRPLFTPYLQNLSNKTPD